MDRARKIYESAAAWVARRDRDLSTAEIVEFRNWLNASTENRIAYLRAEAAWKRTERMAALNSKQQDEIYSRSRSLRYAGILAAIAALVTLTVFSYNYLSRNVDARYQTGSEERRLVSLSDGTQIQLGPDSRILTHVTPSGRMVVLEKGRGDFDVVHDAAHPFVVLVGNRRITDLGTEFSVSLSGDQTKVIVRKGRIRIDALNRGVHESPVFAEAGYTVIAKADETLVLNEGRERLSRRADVLDQAAQILIFNGETLAAAADEFNSTNEKKLLVVGDARTIHVGGHFRAQDVEGFAQLMHEGFGLKVAESDGAIILSK